jgi:5-methylcytosine-specific restriction endonuclease McrA
VRAVSKKRAKAKPAERAAREAVFERDRGCVLTGWSPCAGPLTPHHLLKQSQGGPWALDNLVALCAHHNGDVEDWPAKYRGLGLAVAKGVDATEAARLRAVNGIAPNWRPLIEGSAA